MPLISTLGAASSRGFGEFTQSTQANYIENFFNTYLYNGNGSTLAINNGIPLAGTGSWSALKFFEANSAFVSGVDIDSSSNLYVCGRDDDGPNPNYGFIAKFDSSGVLQWNKKLSTSAQTYFNSVKVASSGNVYGSGYSNPNGFLVKYNSSGVLQWQRKISHTGLTQILSVDVDSSENVYAAGYSTDAASTYPILLKYDSSGTLQWQRRLADLTTGYTSIFRSVACDSSGNVFVTGNIQDSTSRVAIFAKYNSSGTIQWQRKIRGGALSESEGKDIYPLPSGDILISWFSIGDLYLSKLTSTGSTNTWDASLKGGSGGSLAYISVTSGGDIFLASNIPETGSSNLTITLIKFNSSGTLQWQRRLISSYSDSTAGAFCVYATDTNTYVGGYARDQNAADFGVLAKIPNDGSATSGIAFVNMFPGSLTDPAGGSINSVGGATASTSVATDAANTLTDGTATNTITEATQQVVANQGGLVWLKGRSGATDHALYDTSRGATLDIASNLTTGQTTQTTGLTAFSASGFAIGSLAKLNTSSAIYAAWTFREQAKFFDVVTYTGNGANRTIAHNLGSVPGMILIKRTDTTAAWAVYHRSLANTEYMVLNSANAKATGTTYWNSTTPTSTVFSLGTSTDVNANTGTYVAYLFAHNAAGFGLDGTQNVISCGSYTGNGSATGPSVSLGYEPQFVLIKNSNDVTNWALFDNMRGIATGAADPLLSAETTTAEVIGNGDLIDVTATGFSIKSISGIVNTNANTYIYMAIRRGPMAVPTDATKVFMPTVYTGTNVDNRLVNTTIAPDMVWARQRNSTTLTGMVVGDRLRGQPYSVTGSGASESNDADAFDAQIVSAAEYGTAFSSMNGVWVGNNATAQLNASTTASNQIMEAFKRAPGFFDIVAYTGTGSATTVNHNLGAVPQLILVKRRNLTVNWGVYSANLNNTEYLVLNANSARATGTTYWNSTTPTSTAFSVGTASNVNASGGTYIAYLFTTCQSVSKVGSYFGTGTTQQINCGFNSGSRFVLIKRVDSSGDWYVYDSARGIVAGNDPYIVLQSASAEVTSTDYVDTYSAGFELSSTAPAGLNELIGTTWTTRSTGITDYIQTVSYGNGIYLAGSLAGVLRTSTNTTSWTSRTSNFGTTNINGSAYGGGTYVIVGDSGTLASSTDAITWTLRTSNFGTSGITKVTYGNGTFVAVGGSGKISTSTDGITWTARTSGTTDLCIAVGYGNSLFLLSAGNGNLFTSPDGITWTARTSGFGTSSIRGIAYGNGIYVIGGDNGKLSTSTDGITWTSRTSGFGTTNINSISYGNGIFVAGGNSGTMTTSTDGITWTSRTSGFGTSTIASITNGNDIFVAGGGDVATSSTLTTSTLPTYIYLAIA